MKHDKKSGIENEDLENQQPLSLLALHDEEDLINLSSTALRPSNPESHDNLKDKKQV